MTPSTWRPRSLHEVAERPVTETEGTLLFACNQVIDHLEQIGRSPTTIDGYRHLACGVLYAGRAAEVWVS